MEIGPAGQTGAAGAPLARPQRTAGLDPPSAERTESAGHRDRLFTLARGPSGRGDMPPKTGGRGIVGTERKSDRPPGQRRKMACRCDPPRAPGYLFPP